MKPSTDVIKLELNLPARLYADITMMLEEHKGYCKEKDCHMASLEVFVVSGLTAWAKERKVERALREINEESYE